MLRTRSFRENRGRILRIPRELSTGSPYPAGARVGGQSPRADAMSGCPDSRPDAATRHEAKPDMSPWCFGAPDLVPGQQRSVRSSQRELVGRHLVKHLGTRRGGSGKPKRFRNDLLEVEAYRGAFHGRKCRVETVIKGAQLVR